MHRLFVALRPPEPVRDALIDTTEGLEGARWQGDEPLHLTLRHVGAVDRSRPRYGTDAPTSPVANLAEGPFHLLIGSQQSIRAIQLF